MRYGIRADGLADRGATHRGDDRGRVGGRCGIDMRAVAAWKADTPIAQW